MIKRNGFVSNSSSSSFIVIFNKKPESVEDTQRALFGSIDHNAKHYTGECFDNRDEVDQRYIAKRVFEDVQDQDNLSVKEIADNYLRSSLYYYREKSIWDDEEGRFYGNGKPYFGSNHEIMEKLYQLRNAQYDSSQYEELNKLKRKASMADASAMANDNKNKFIAKFEYGDESGEGVFEHTRIFDRLKHIRISHH